MMVIFIIFVLIALFIIVPNLFVNSDARSTDRPEDLTVIKMNYEGLQGSAGPNMTVVSIVRCGTTIGFGRAPPRRKYRVVLRSVDGRERTKIVSVSPSDELYEYRKNG